MKKNLLIKKNNKGVALISIMIAIMFVSVIASTILYLSYSNYKIKVANISSKENFYETDGELIKVTSKLRNSFESNPESALTSLAQTGNTKKYDCKKIAELVYPSTDTNHTVSGTSDKAKITNTKNNDIIYIIGASGDNMPEPTEPISKVKRYTLKGIEIKQENEKGFVNSVKTDLIFDVVGSTSGGGGAGGVGNFSMLFDSYLDASSSNFATLSLYGNSYVANANGIYTYPSNSSATNYVAKYAGQKFTKPGKNGDGKAALKLDNECKINFIGDYNVVFGDIYLSGRSSIYVYGSLTVYGDIILDGNSTLICAGKIYMVQPESSLTATQKKEYYLPGRTSFSDIVVVDNNKNKHLYPSNLTVTKLKRSNYDDFCSELKYNNGDVSDDGLINQILNPVSFGTSSAMKVVDVNQNLNKINNVDTKKVKFNNCFYGESIGFYLNDKCVDTLNGGLDHYLIINAYPGTCKMQNNNTNSTFISKYPFKVEQVHNITLSKIGTDEFNYITAHKGDLKSKPYDTTTNPFNTIKLSFSNWGDYNGSIGSMFTSNCNEVVDKMFKYSNGGNSGTPTYTSVVKFDNYTRDF